MFSSSRRFLCWRIVRRSNDCGPRHVDEQQQ